MSHTGVGEPVVQYLRINQGDRKRGRPVVDARNGVPVYTYLVFHDCGKTPQEHWRQELLELVSLAEMHLNPTICFFEL